MPTPDNTVTLLINGKTHGQWTNYDIVSDLLTPADDFSVTLGRPVDAKPDAVRAGDKVEARKSLTHRVAQSLNMFIRHHRRRRKTKN